CLFLFLTLFTFLVLDAHASRVTQRFGDQSTCDVTSKTLDVAVAGQYPTQRWGNAASLNYRDGSDALFYFDVSAIPAGRTVRRAVLRIYLAEDYLKDGVQTGTTVAIHPITDPA